MMFGSSSRPIPFRIAVLALIAASGLAIAPSPAGASDISWTGYYRFEALHLHDAELSSQGYDTGYMLHHMMLAPKIVAGDGLTLYGRFDLLNNGTYGQNNQFGEFLGSGPDSIYSATGQTPTPSNSGNSNVLSRAAASGAIAVTQAYAVWTQEFGSVIVGRVPIQFGLGLVHNAGNGLFDHYYETKDIVAYKAVLGNVFVMPMIGRVDEGNIGQENEISEYMLHVQYDNPETDLSLGVFFEQRIGTQYSNDSPLSGSASLGTSIAGGYKTQLWSVYTKQRVQTVLIAVEGDFETGDSGVYNTAAGQTVTLNAFGIAAQVDWKPEESRWAYGAKFGLATGDDPGTANSDEGFQFNKNYDVAFLMFNHPLGQFDVLRTGLVRNTTITASAQPDTEALSNAVFVAPNFEWKWRDNLSLNGTLLYAMLNKDPVANGNTPKDLGYEADIGVTYKPYQRLTWKSQIGYLLPGKAWTGGSVDNYENRPAYGMETKAIITF